MRSEEKVEVIILSGPSGVGKTTLAYEMTAILKEHQIGHALIDADELDRLFPESTDANDLFEGNLRAIWTNFAERGCKRLILCAVFTGAIAAPQEVVNAIGPNASIQLFRIEASEQDIRNRLAKREVGSLLEQHIVSSKRARNLNTSTDNKVQIITNDKEVRTIATESLITASWLSD